MVSKVSEIHKIEARIAVRTWRVKTTQSTLETVNLSELVQGSSKFDFPSTVACDMGMTDYAYHNSNELWWDSQLN